MQQSTHTTATREDLKTRLRQDRQQRSKGEMPVRVVFERTVGKLAAYMKHGCGTLTTDSRFLDNNAQGLEDEELSQWRAATVRSRRGHRTKHQQPGRLCEGRLLLSYDYDGQPYVQ